MIHLKPMQRARLRHAADQLDEAKRPLFLMRASAALRQRGVPRPSDALLDEAISSALRGLVQQQKAS